MSRTRDASGRELMGWLEGGGYQTLIDTLEGRIRQLGGELRTASRSIRSRRLTAARRASSSTAGFVLRAVLCTLAPPQARRLLPERLAANVPADGSRISRDLPGAAPAPQPQPVLPPQHHGPARPLTTVVETTHVVDPEFVGGHLVYAAKYADPMHTDFDRPAEEIEQEYLAHVRQIFPSLGPSDVLGAVVQRARITEPVHLLGGAKNLPDMFPVPGLALASTTHVYPEIVSGQAVIGVADRVVKGLLEQLPFSERAAA